ncbi:MAG: acetolactate synthase large subunit [Leptospiraceae bacterium]|nr:MAG: acetolactate synthase large subunit [Leptospiraceae bacterium]
MANKRKGGDVIAEMLFLEGVDRVFGIIDGTYFGFYSSLNKYGIELISPRHETSAAHMAGAYYRLSGKLGVCMASNGPGVANILPGLVVEEAEGNRVLVITSFRRQGIVNPVRLGTYQYFNQSETIKQFAKVSYLVTSPQRIPEIMRMALRKCYEGRPGVVHIDVPEDIMNGEYEISFQPLKPENYRATTIPYPEQNAVIKTIELLKKSKYPIIHFGSGIIHAKAQNELKEILSFLKIPVTYSWGARTVLLENLDYLIPMTNISLNHFIHRKADLAIVLGSRLGETDWWGRAPYWNQKDLKVIQVDIESEIIGSSRNIYLGIISDVKAYLESLLHYLKKDTFNFNFKWNEFNEKIKKLNLLSKEKLSKIANQKTKLVHPAQLILACNKYFPDNTTYVIDGGNTAVWSQFYLDIKQENSMISTYKFGMLGAGVSQAIGASYAKENDVIVCLIGDGAMGFHPQEIETAVRNKRKIIYIVFCDKQWGMVKINQSFALRPLKTLLFKHLSPEENINTDFGDIDFAKLAESMGAKGFRINQLDNIKEIIEECLNFSHCSVIHVDVDPVKHMWAPGLIDFKKMHLEPSGK